MCKLDVFHPIFSPRGEKTGWGSDTGKLPQSSAFADASPLSEGASGLQKPEPPLKGARTARWAVH